MLEEVALLAAMLPGMMRLNCARGDKRAGRDGSFRATRNTLQSRPKWLWDIAQRGAANEWDVVHKY